MLPMSAYVAAYVHLLPEMRGAYVPMCFSGFWPGEPVDTDKLDKLDKAFLHFLPPPMVFLKRLLGRHRHD